MASRGAFEPTPASVGSCTVRAYAAASGGVVLAESGAVAGAAAPASPGAASTVTQGGSNPCTYDLRNWETYGSTFDLTSGNITLSTAAGFHAATRIHSSAGTYEDQVGSFFAKSGIDPNTGKLEVPTQYGGNYAGAPILFAGAAAGDTLYLCMQIADQPPVQAGRGIPVVP